MQLLIDMELLAHADYLVASDRSKWSKILQYMRYILYSAPCTCHRLAAASSHRRDPLLRIQDLRTASMRRGFLSPHLKLLLLQREL